MQTMKKGKGQERSNAYIKIEQNKNKGIKYCVLRQVSSYGIGRDRCNISFIHCVPKYKGKNLALLSIMLSIVN